jgi:hypothetical protein
MAAGSEPINLELIKAFKEMLDLLGLPPAEVEIHKRRLVQMVLDNLLQEIKQRPPTLQIEEEVRGAGRGSAPVPTIPPPPIPSRMPPAPPAATPPPSTATKIGGGPTTP